MRINKSRIIKLEKERQHKLLPNGGCAVVNYVDDPLPEEELKAYREQGVKIIDVVFGADETIVRKKWQ